jgi:hypothetical protein
VIKLLEFYLTLVTGLDVIKYLAFGNTCSLAAKPQPFQQSKMADTNCPICYSELIAKEVAPCMDCGASEQGLQQLMTATYTEYQTYFNQRLVLCNFCDVDFSSYKPEYFGFSSDKKIGLQDFNFVRQVADKSLRVDKYCPHCDKRLAFLKFVNGCRQNNSGEGIQA